jgi:hypothetical protein
LFLLSLLFYVHRDHCRLTLGATEESYHAGVEKMQMLATCPFLITCQQAHHSSVSGAANERKKKNKTKKSREAPRR